MMILDQREVSGRVVFHHVTFVSDDGDEMGMIMLHPFEGGVATEVVFFDESQETKPGTSSTASPSSSC